MKSAPDVSNSGSPTTVQSACGAKPNVTVSSHGLRATQSARNASSAFSTAVPAFGKWSSSSPFADATPASEPKPSRCAAPAFVMMPTVGSARLAR